MDKSWCDAMTQMNGLFDEIKQQMHKKESNPDGGGIATQLNMGTRKILIVFINF